MFSSRYDAALTGFYCVVVADVVSGVGLGVVYAVLSWREQQLGPGAKVWNTVLALATLAYAFLAWNWNALNFRLNY